MDLNPYESPRVLDGPEVRAGLGGRSEEVDGLPYWPFLDIVIVVINLDPHGARETTVHLNMPALGMGWHDTFNVYDEVTEQTWNWKERNYVRLDPGHEPAHILSVRTS